MSGAGALPSHASAPFVALRGPWRRTAVLLVALLALIGAYKLLSSAGIWHQPWHSFQPGWLTACFALATLHRFLTPLGWWYALQALGVRDVRIHEMRYVYLLTEIARYLPGALWNYSGRAWWCMQRGIPSPIAAGCQLLELLMLAMSALLASLCTLLPYRGAYQACLENVANSWTIEMAACLFVGAAFFAILCALARNKLMRLLNKLALLREMRLGAPSIQMGMAVQFLLHITMGMAFALLCMSYRVNAPLAACVGAASAAWLIGLGAIFAPGGLVVREAAIVSLMAAWASPADALHLALAWRIVQTLAEFSALGLATLLGPKHPQS